MSSIRHWSNWPIRTKTITPFRSRAMKFFWLLRSSKIFAQSAEVLAQTWFIFSKLNLPFCFWFVAQSLIYKERSLATYYALLLETHSNISTTLFLSDSKPSTPIKWSLIARRDSKLRLRRRCRHEYHPSTRWITTTKSKLKTTMTWQRHRMRK